MKIQFKTSNDNSYLYDSLTNYIFSDIKKGVLDDIPFHEIRWPSTFEDYLLKLEHNIPRMGIELTKHCNLHCSYCTVCQDFEKEDHIFNMSKETLFRGIDFYFTHNSDCQAAHIYFYGGEPLLRFELIKEAVHYAIKCSGELSISFSISSNGLLLDEKIVSWLAENSNININITLNGPFQDSYRKHSDGTGSLELLLSRLTYIRQNFADVWNKQINLLANVDYEFQVVELLDFYKKYIGKMPTLITGIRWGKNNDNYKNNVIYNYTIHYSNELNEHLKNYLKKSILGIHNRGLSNSPDSFISSCFPGEIELFVCYNGSLSFCEKMSRYPSIGNIYTGYDIKILKQIYCKLYELTNQTCKSCWCQRLCHICLAKLYDDRGEILMEIPSKLCEEERRDVLEHLIRYCEIAEIAPELLD